MSAPSAAARFVAGPILPGRAVMQVFRAGEDFLGAVAPVVATYGRVAGGVLSLSLHVARYDPPRIAIGAVVASRTVAGAELDDNEAIDLVFEPIAGSAGQTYALVLASTGADAGEAATVWLTTGGGRISGHVACVAEGREQGNAGIEAALYYCPVVSPKAVPAAILYSPLSQCNLNCIHCISRASRAAVHRLDGTIKARIDHHCRVGDIGFLVTDYSGDLLWADHRTPGELDFVLGLGIPFHVDTNGTHLSESVSRELAGSRLASINISLDAASDANFRRIRRGAPPLDVVIENIRILLRVREETGAGFSVSLGFTLMRGNLAEWPDFLRLAASLGVEAVMARHLEAYTEDMAEESLWHDQDGYNAMRRRIVALGAELGLRLAVPPAFGAGAGRAGHRVCGAPWHSAVVLGNGDVAACCVPTLVMGNLHSSSLEEIWNGPRYQALRRTVNTPMAPAQCQACPMLRLTRNADSYLVYRSRLRGEARV